MALMLISEGTIVNERGKSTRTEAIFDESVALQAAIISHLSAALASTVIISFTRHALATVGIAIGAAWLTRWFDDFSVMGCWHGSFTHRLLRGQARRFLRSTHGFLPVMLVGFTVAWCVLWRGHWLLGHDWMVMGGGRFALGDVEARVINLWFFRL